VKILENNRKNTNARIIKDERERERERENYDFKIPENNNVVCYYFSLCGDDGFAARVPAESERGEEINLIIISLLLFIQSIDVVAIVVVVRATRTTTEKNEKRRRFDNEHG
jgi:hypothetical protein